MTVQQGNQFVVFKLNDEFYGVDIYNVKTIERLSEFTRVPNAANYVKGVINLRGDVITVIDLSERFQCNNNKNEKDSRIIIISIEDIDIGLLVDSSSEVIEISPEAIDPPPDIGNNSNEEYIKGIGKVKDRLILLLDLEKTIGVEKEK